WEALVGVRPFSGTTLGELRSAIARGPGPAATGGIARVAGDPGPRAVGGGAGADARHGPTTPDPSPRNAGRPLPGKIRRALVRALAPDPEARFASIEALVAALELRRARWLVPVAFAATTAAGVAGWIVATRSSAEADPCTRPTAELAGVWDAAKRDAIA